jgi:hypothetical protein
VLALAVYDFHTALAGQSVFQGKLLEEWAQSPLESCPIAGRESAAEGKRDD